LVDTRLYSILQRRPKRLRQQDLPPVAKAIVAVIRKKSRASVGVHQNLSYVWLRGDDPGVVVLKEDWEKILPYIEDGTFDPTQTPVPRVVPLDPNVMYDEATIDLQDSYLYSRVLVVLRQLFPEKYPTSDL
jgi:hypothetical protein